MAKKETKIKNDKKNSFKSLKAELKKVIWPTPKQLFNNTMAVVSIVLIVTAIVFILDMAFESVNKYGIDKIKESVVSMQSSNDDTISSDSSTEDENTANETNEVTNDQENTSSESDNAETVENTDTQINSAE